MSKAAAALRRSLTLNKQLMVAAATAGILATFFAMQPVFLRLRFFIDCQCEIVILLKSILKLNQEFVIADRSGLDEARQCEGRRQACASQALATGRRLGPKSGGSVMQSHARVKEPS